MGMATDESDKTTSWKTRLATVKIYGVLLLLLSFSLLVFSSVFRRLKDLPSPISSPPSLTDYNRGIHKAVNVIQWDPQTSRRQVKSTITCDRSHYHYDICSINGPTLLDPTRSTFYAIGSTQPKHFTETIRPYPRKWENLIITKIKELTLKPGPLGPLTCNVVHDAHALVFSAGGYTGNFFHDFNEGFLPLFVTVRSMSLIGKDIVLVVVDASGWWIRKYSDLLGKFSKHRVVTVNNNNNGTGVHCFNSATIGLISHGFMTIDPTLTPNRTTLAHFHYFLDKAYGQAQYQIPPTGRPKLVLMIRSGGASRILLNQAQVQTLAEKLGFDVILFEPKPETPVKESYKLMKQSHVMIGIHGAALTHMLFLRPGSIFIQVVPIGTSEVAELCFGKAAKEMGLEYLEYSVTVDESSLVGKYQKYDPILTDSMSIQGKGWNLVKNVYLKDQNVSVDLVRFRWFLKVAYRKAKRFMHQTIT